MKTRGKDRRKEMNRKMIIEEKEGRGERGEEGEKRRERKNLRPVGKTGADRVRTFSILLLLEFL